VRQNDSGHASPALDFVIYWDLIPLKILIARTCEAFISSQLGASSATMQYHGTQTKERKKKRKISIMRYFEKWRGYFRHLSLPVKERFCAGDTSSSAMQ